MEALLIILTTALLLGFIFLWNWLDRQEELKKNEKEHLTRENQENLKREIEERLKRMRYKKQERLKREEEEERLKCEEKERLKREEEERLEREQRERFKREWGERLKREEEERLKREEEERLKREEEERLKREEEERKQSEFEKSPRGRLEKAIKISRDYELFVFIEEMLNASFITEGEGISRAEQDRSAFEAVGIMDVGRVISFTFEGFQFSIVLKKMSTGFGPDDRSLYGSCWLMVNSELVLETWASSYSDGEWYSSTNYSIYKDSNWVKLIKLDEWLEQIPRFRKSHLKAQFDAETARKLEQNRREEEALDKNVSLGKFNQSE